MTNLRLSRRAAPFALLLLLFWSALPVPAQSTIASVQAASVALAGQLASAEIEVSFEGLGLVSGEMVDMTLTNSGQSEATLRFVPGMVLDDPTGQVQPIMLEESVELTLEPGESIRKTLRAYCLDHSKDAPSGAAAENYELATDLLQYEPAIDVIYAGLELERAQKLRPVLRPVAHRTVVLQRSIWASVGEKNPKSRQELAGDIRQEIATANNALFAPEQVDCLSKRIWSDVQRILQAAGPNP